MPPIIPATDDFRIRIVGSPAYNRPPTPLAEYLQIWDFQNSMAAYYNIPAEHSQPEASLNHLAAKPFKGPWNPFHVVTPCPVTFFEGLTRRDMRLTPRVADKFTGP